MPVCLCVCVCVGGGGGVRGSSNLGGLNKWFVFKYNFYRKPLTKKIFETLN